MFECAICGKEYEELSERIDCETKCLKELEESIELKKQEEYEQRRNESSEAINAALAEVDKMLKTHMKEFKSFVLQGNLPYLKYIFKNSFWWM